jgi:murein DD-endopeptidase MepM/ murein hydrolase activator NlpD
VSAARRAAWLTGAALLVATVQAGAEPPALATPPPPRVHVVVSGDTLGGIAARYKVTLAALTAANRLTEGAVLKLGQRIVIPVAASAPAPPGPGQTAAVMPRPATPSPTPTRAAPKSPAAPSRRLPAIGPRGLELAVPDFVETSPAFVWPVEGPISSVFGRRRNAWHRGIDIKAEPGTVIFASAAGVVLTAGTEPRYGRVVKIEHDDGYVTVYAHNEENLVDAGSRVATGDPIATIGRTGRATAHHLHFEIRRNGGVYNPLYLLPLPPRVSRVEESDEPDEEHD